MNLLIRNLLVVLLLSLLAEAQVYRAEDLGTLPGGENSQAFAINAQGQVVGLSLPARGLDHGVLWTPGKRKQDLGTFQPPSINDSTQIAGSMTNANGFRHAFLWTQSGGLQDLGTLPGFDSSTAPGINDLGEVVGTSWTAAIGPCPSGSFLWTIGGGLHNLGFPSDTCDGPTGLNLFSEVVGSAFLWTPAGGLQDLGGDAWAINNSGTIAGFVLGPPGAQPSIWTNLSGWQTLSTITGEAYGINALGAVVGSYDNPSSPIGRSGFVWTEAAGIQDLNNLFTSIPGWWMVQAFGVNLRGQIVGVLQQTNGGDFHALLLTPVASSSQH